MILMAVGQQSQTEVIGCVTKQVSITFLSVKNVTDVDATLILRFHF